MSRCLRSFDVDFRLGPIAVLLGAVLVPADACARPRSLLIEASTAGAPAASWIEAFAAEWSEADLFRGRPLSAALDEAMGAPAVTSGLKQELDDALRLVRNKGLLGDERLRRRLLDLLRPLGRKRLLHPLEVFTEARDAAFEAQVYFAWALWIEPDRDTADERREAIDDLIVSFPERKGIDYERLRGLDFRKEVERRRRALEQQPQPYLDVSVRRGGPTCRVFIDEMEVFPDGGRFMRKVLRGIHRVVTSCDRGRVGRVHRIEVGDVRRALAIDAVTDAVLDTASGDGPVLRFGSAAAREEEEVDCAKELLAVSRAERVLILGTTLDEKNRPVATGTIVVRDGRSRREPVPLASGGPAEAGARLAKVLRAHAAALEDSWAAAAAKKQRRMRIFGLALLGAGVVAAAVGGYLLSFDQKCTMDTPGQECPNLFSTAPQAIALFSAGGAAAVAGSVLTGIGWAPERGAPGKLFINMSGTF